MTVAHPWLVLAAVLPLLWAAWEWRRSAGRLRLVLKALSLIAVLLALAEPRLPVDETKAAVAILVDTSSSMSDADLKQASDLVGRMQSQQGRHWTRVVPFAQTTRSVNDADRKGGWNLRRAANETGTGTNLEAAVRGAMAALPAGLVPRLALISDGNENQGSIARAAWQAQQLKIPIDTFAVKGRPRPVLHLESVSVARNAFTGERIPIDLTISSPRRLTGQVEIKAEDKLLGRSTVALEPGINTVRVHVTLATTGAVALAGTINAGDLGEVRFDQALSLRRPKVLYVSADPPGTEQHLFSTLEAAQFEIVRASDAPNSGLSDYQLAVFNNWDIDGLAPARKEALEQYVKQGGGLLVIGGEQNIYREEKKDKPEDALDRTLPAKLAPPRSPEGTCVILIIDKSSSMEGRKMELARLAAIGVIENLRPVDMVGVLIFDNSFQWAVPLRKAEDRTLIKRLVAGITPDGGTQIAPALSEGYRRAVPVTATYKHIVLLTDGISEEGDSIQLAREAGNQRVTISTVGLGQDVNRSYLEKVATFSNGKAYFLNDPSGLEQILIKDVMEHTGSTAVEKPIMAQVMQPSEVLDGVGMEAAPPLKGYVKFTSKPTADTILMVDNKDPLLARWQYGLGRAAVFTSDAKSRWAAQWVDWKGYDRFWSNLFRDLLPHAQGGEAVANYDSTTGNLVVQYRLAPHVPAPASLPDVFVLGAAGFQKPIPVRKVAEGAYRGELHIGNQTGLFRIRPLVDSPAFPEVGFYREDQEAADFGSNETLLRQVAEFTGGRFQPAPAAVFETGGKSIVKRMELWPGLIALAIALTLLELFLRKWRTVLA